MKRIKIKEKEAAPPLHSHLTFSYTTTTTTTTEHKKMDESNYDEFGNYIGPDVDSDVDSEDDTRRRGVSMLVRILFCTSRTNDFFPAPLFCVNPNSLSLSLVQSRVM